MGKSHIGLVYSQQINEVLDQLANLVSRAGPSLRLHFHYTCQPPRLEPCGQMQRFPHGSFLGSYFKNYVFENRALTLDEALALLLHDRVLYFTRPSAAISLYSLWPLRTHEGKTLFTVTLECYLLFFLS